MADIEQIHEIAVRWCDKFKDPMVIFQSLCRDDVKPTVNGMCNSLWIHRDTLHTWRTGEYRADPHRAIIMKAYRVMEELREGYMLNGKINPVSGIFFPRICSMVMQTSRSLSLLRIMVFSRQMLRPLRQSMMSYQRDKERPGSHPWSLSSLLLNAL